MKSLFKSYPIQSHQIPQLSQHSLLFILLEPNEDSEIQTACKRLIEYNDWSWGINEEVLADLCHYDEFLAHIILNSHNDLWTVESVCVQLYKSCAERLIDDASVTISETSRIHLEL